MLDGLYQGSIAIVFQVYFKSNKKDLTQKEKNILSEILTKYLEVKVND